jgi:hypothetical protein
MIFATVRALFRIGAFMNAVDSTPGLEGLSIFIGHYSYETVMSVRDIEDKNQRIGFIQPKFYVGELVVFENKPNVVRAIVDGNKVKIGKKVDR